MSFALPIIAGAIAATSHSAHAIITIGDEAFGSTTPSIAPGDQQVINGDFLIHENLAAPTTGDGVDEATTWTFDFTADANYAAFAASGQPLTTAVLTLTLTQFYPEGPITDLVRPVDMFPNIEMPHFLSAGQTGSIQFELLDYYTSSDILAFIDAHNGTMPMIYADDAIVSYANLRIAMVPPAPVAALGGIAMIFGGRRRR